MNLYKKSWTKFVLFQLKTEDSTYKKVDPKNILVTELSTVLLYEKFEQSGVYGSKPNLFPNLA